MENNQNNKTKQDAEKLLRNYRVETSSSKEEVLKELLRKIDEKEQISKAPQRRITWYLAGAASVAATIAILVAFWFFTASETISAGQGEIFAFRLPDDSRVILHDESSLSYRKHLWNRDVKLTGEAYFEVEKGAGFRVKTRAGKVEVLGTRFRVQEEAEGLMVQCFEGKVKTSFADDSWILEPGTQFTGRPETAQKEIFTTENGYPGFARFQRNFSNTPLREVVREIENFFEVDIRVNIPAGKNFSGSVQTGNLENVLRIVCEPLQLNYHFEDKYSIVIFKNQKQ
jgi:transmembrane sensor